MIAFGYVFAPLANVSSWPIAVVTEGHYKTERKLSSPKQTIGAPSKSAQLVMACVARESIWRPIALWLVAVLASSLGSVAAAPAADPKPTTQRLIIKFKDGLPQAIEDRVARLAAERQVRLSHVRGMALGAHLVALERALPMSKARAIASELASSSEVAYVEPERRFRVDLVPNDPGLGAQTYLQHDAGGINAFGAWDISTGNSRTVVAVVDTGYRPHAALSGRVLPGYDFVSYLPYANDGDLRDADATDPGNWVTQADLKPGGSLFMEGCPFLNDSTWHGTKIAGLIAANANDGAWTVGIDWAARILPVRALGRCYGQTSDLLDAVAWAGGLSVPGVPDNPYPAQVINLSFGESDGGGCGPAQQAVITAVLTHAVTKAIVASAGNDSTDVARQSPADCDGVISVGATNSVDGRASYSNFGAMVTISAPGGDPGKGLGEIVVLSNSGKTTPEGDILGTAYGTSVAAPMVSGVVSLMLSVAPNLTAAHVRSILTTTSKPFPPGSDCGSATCGAGIVDAQAAVQAAQVFDQGLVPVVEYYYAAWDHYFETAFTDEIAGLDGGAYGGVWKRTGQTFNAWPQPNASASPTCRFFSTSFAPKSSHFYTPYSAECETVKTTNPNWEFESIAFYMYLIDADGNCPPETIPLYRLYNNGKGGAPNHRYTTSVTVFNQMSAAGWVFEGNRNTKVFACVPQ